MVEKAPGIEIERVDTCLRVTCFRVVTNKSEISLLTEVLQKRVLVL